MQIPRALARGILFDILEHMKIFEKRDTTLDIARGTLIVLMIIFHVFINFTWSWLPYSFIIYMLHPITFAFAFLSGVSLCKFCQSKPYSYFVRKSLKLIALFVILNLIRVLYEPSTLNIGNVLGAILIGKPDNFSFAILLSLAISMLVFPPIQKYRLASIIILSSVVFAFNFILIQPGYNFDIYLAFSLGVLVTKNYSSLVNGRKSRVVMLLMLVALAIIQQLLPNQSLLAIVLGSLYAVILWANSTHIPGKKMLISISGVSLFIYITHVMFIKLINVMRPGFRTQDFVVLIGVCICLMLIFRTVSYCITKLLKYKAFRSIYSVLF